MDPSIHKFLVSRDVVLDEVSSYYGANEVPIENEKTSSLELIVSNLPQSPRTVTTPLDEQSERGSIVSGQDGSNSGSLIDVQEAAGIIDAEVQDTRTRRNIVKPARYRDGKFCKYIFLLAKGVKEWELAMNEEMNALVKNETWVHVPKPKDIQPLSCKWV